MSLIGINENERFQQSELIGRSANVGNREIFTYIDKQNGNILAFKRLPLRAELAQSLPCSGTQLSALKEEEHGVPCMTVRQVSLHRLMNHENVASLVFIGYDQIVEDTIVRLGLEYAGKDLKTFQRDNPRKAKDPELIKSLLRQLLSGVAHYHSIQAAHGNLKPYNVLIDEYKSTTTKDEYNLKITNLDIKIENGGSYSAPELLLGSMELSPAADMFSVGCIFAEMLREKPLFLSRKGVEHIFMLLGTPNEENWPGVTELYKEVSTYKKYTHKDLLNEFPGLEEAGVDLISKLLCLNPSKRITAVDALKHDYFAKPETTTTAAGASSSGGSTSASVNP